LGADGQAKYEIRYPNGTVVGNFTFINDRGETETRWYSAGDRGTEISGDSVISPAPPTLVDETTGPNYVDLSNYELYRHLEVPYVHIAGPSDPDERGQLSAPGSSRSSSQAQPPRLVQQRQQQPQQLQRPIQPVAAPVPLDFGDDTRFVRVDQAAPQPPRSQPIPVQAAQPRRTRVRVASNKNAGRTTQQIAQSHFNPAQFNPAQINNRSPDAVLDSLISQFQ